MLTVKEGSDPRQCTPTVGMGTPTAGHPGGPPHRGDGLPQVVHSPGGAFPWDPNLINHYVFFKYVW